jgi:AbrB family looped-hinge helix DNA binding protein
MAKVTSKLQVTIPKRIAQSYGIQPGDEIEFVSAGDTIRVIPPGAAGGRTASTDRAEQLRLFDAATARQQKRERGRHRPRKTPRTRGWTRAGLYDRGRTR